MKVIRPLIGVALALLLTGCPMRQAARRLVYVPAPPPAASAGSGTRGDVLVIPAPAPPPAPAAASPKHDETAAPVAVQRPVRHRPAVHDQPTGAANPAATEDETAGATTAPAAGPPQLAPARSAQQQVELEKEIDQLRDAIRKRIERLSHKPLSSADREAIQDARLFLSQADQATHQGDLQQSLNLAQKADLLIAAVEKRY